MIIFKKISLEPIKYPLIENISSVLLKKSQQPAMNNTNCGIPSKNDILDYL